MSAYGAVTQSSPLLVLQSSAQQHNGRPSDRSVTAVFRLDTFLQAIQGGARRPNSCPPRHSPSSLSGGQHIAHPISNYLCMPTCVPVSVRGSTDWRPGCQCRAISNCSRSWRNLRRDMVICRSRPAWCVVHALVRTASMTDSLFSSAFRRHLDFPHVCVPAVVLYVTPSQT